MATPALNYEFDDIDLPNRHFRHSMGMERRHDYL